MARHGTTSPDELLAIGEILRPRGVQGEMKLRLLCDDYEDFLDCTEAGELFLWWPRGKEPIRAPQNPRTLEIPPVVPMPQTTRKTPAPSAAKASGRVALRMEPPWRVRIDAGRFHAGYVLLQLEGVTTVEGAEMLRGAHIGIRADGVPEPEEGSFYQFELEGLTVVDTQGKTLGVVEAVQENPAHDFLAVRSSMLGVKPFLVPLVEPFVKQVDLQNGRIVVDLPKGLIETAIQ